MEGKTYKVLVEGDSIKENEIKEKKNDKNNTNLVIWRPSHLARTDPEGRQRPDKERPGYSSNRSIYY